MIPQLMTSIGRAPRERFRGKGKYFRRVHRGAEDIEISPKEGDWWDLWHFHADWRGWGNLRWKYRLEHIRALANVFRKIAGASAEFATPFQTWIYLSGRDAGEDATYLHTPNANGTPFPVVLREVRWGSSPLLRVFSELLPEYTLHVGESRVFDEYIDPPRIVCSFFIYADEVGTALTQGLARKCNA
jgi:hypothetical protein